MDTNDVELVMDEQRFREMKFAERIEYTTNVLHKAHGGHEPSFAALAKLMSASTLFAQVVCFKPELRTKFADTIKQWAAVGREYARVDDSKLVLDVIMTALSGILQHNKRVHFVEVVDALMANDALPDVARLLVMDSVVTERTYTTSSQLLVLYSVHSTPIYKPILMRIALLDTCARMHRLARMDPIQDEDYVLLTKFINDNVLYMLRHARAVVLVKEQFQDCASAMEVVCEFLAAITTGAAAHPDNRSRVFVENVCEIMLKFLCEVVMVINENMETLIARGLLTMELLQKTIGYMKALRASSLAPARVKTLTSAMSTWVVALEPKVSAYMSTALTLVRMLAEDTDSMTSTSDAARQLIRAHDSTVTTADDHQQPTTGLMTAYLAQRQKTHALQQALRVVKQEREKLQADIDASEDAIRELRQRASALDKEHEAALQTATAADHRNTKLLSACARLQDSNADLTQQRRDLTRSVHDLHSTVNDLQITVDDLQGTVDDLQSTVDDLQSTHAAKALLVQTLRNEVCELELQYGEVKAANDRMRKRLHALVASQRTHTIKTRNHLLTAVVAAARNV